jgi:hypothetical protein
MSEMKKQKKTRVDGIWGSRGKTFRIINAGYKAFNEQCQSFNKDLKIKIQPIFRKIKKIDFEFLAGVDEKLYRGKRRERSVWSWIGDQPPEPELEFVRLK